MKTGGIYLVNRLSSPMQCILINLNSHELFKLCASHGTPTRPDALLNLPTAAKKCYKKES